MQTVVSSGEGRMVLGRFSGGIMLFFISVKQPQVFNITKPYNSDRLNTSLCMHQIFQCLVC